MDATTNDSNAACGQSVLTGGLGGCLAGNNQSIQQAIAKAWNDGFDFARKGSGWQEGEDPSTEGLYVVRDSKGNIEVGMWYAKTTSGQAAEWSKEFRDVNRDDIVAWMRVPPNVSLEGRGDSKRSLLAERPTRSVCWASKSGAKIGSQATADTASCVSNGVCICVNGDNPNFGVHSVDVGVWVIVNTTHKRDWH